jgi:hypothetical protein
MSILSDKIDRKLAEKEGLFERPDWQLFFDTEHARPESRLPG